jgi:Protein of unknown function (DUF2283)
MKKLAIRPDVDTLIVKRSNHPIACAEDEGQTTLHYSNQEKLVLIEVLEFNKMT